MDSTLRAPTPMKFGKIAAPEPGLEPHEQRQELFKLADASVIRPSVGAVWLASAGLIGWSMFSASSPRLFVALAILTIIAAGSWSVRLWLTQ